MKILLVTFSEMLPSVLNKILSPELEFCAVVVDDVEQSKKFLVEEKIFPFCDLKECVINFEYDFVVCITPLQMYSDNFLKQFLKFGVPINKVISFISIHDMDKNFLSKTFPRYRMADPFLLERSLRYYKEHSAEFEMVATGMSYTAYGLDTNKFKHKLFNFAGSSEDIYSNYQVAKFIASNNRGGDRILIGLAPYIFHYDLSKSYINSWKMLEHLICFDDLHNFHVPKEIYRKLFRSEFLNFKLPTDDLDLNNVHYEKVSESMGRYVYVIERKTRIDVWKNKSYPVSLAENVKIFDEYLTLCEEKNFRPIIFLPPMSEMYKKHFKKVVADEFYYIVEKALKKHSTTRFFDGWKLEGFSDEYFFDTDHLNRKGAAKFSELFNEFILNLEADGN